MSNLEFEYLFPIFKKNVLLENLKKLNATLVHPRMKYYVTYFTIKDANYFLRVRKEYNIVSVTRKNFPKEGEFSSEHEIKIKEGSTYSEAIKFIEAIINDKTYTKVEHEKYREKWSVGKNCNEVVIDEWPGLPEYVEVDCKSKESLEKMIDILDKTVFYTSPMSYWKEFYDMKNKDFSKNSLKFNNTILELLTPYINKNHNNLVSMQQLYLTSDLYK